MPGTVILVPGLWVPAWGMLPTAWRLAQSGYRCMCFGYRSARNSLNDNAQQLARFVAECGPPPVALVGHSLGGVLALYTAHRHRLAQVRRIVLVGSPYSDSHAARVLARTAIGRRMLGRTVPDWLAVVKPTAPAGVEVGVITGTRAFGLGMLVARDLPRPHDGVVSASETPVPGMTDAIEVPISHSNMLLSGRVAQLIAAFLREGRFDAARDRPEQLAVRYPSAGRDESR